MKSILDGSVSAATPNVLVYATSNRRHLLPEYLSDNLQTSKGQDGEIHPGEVVEEKISLSERFGLWVSFYPFSQDEYLRVVAHGSPAWGWMRRRLPRPSRSPGLGAGARLAQRPCGPAVCARLCGPQRRSAGSHGAPALPT